jgi:uncharacterized protein YjbI with pentapeptide repeats
MAEKVDPFDISALEKSLNDSATRVSAIWVTYLLFGLYLLTAAGTVTHRQLLLKESIKLPVLNIDLPFLGFWLLAPTLFVILHAYVLIQILLLARTAAAYNDAVDRTVTNEFYRSNIRQRLANTLFAQIFAGSPRERVGLLGLALKLMAWITLAIAPVGILFTFEFTFLPYHSLLVTSVHRLLIAIDLLALFVLWPAALNPHREIGSWNVREFAGGIAVLVVWVFVAVFMISFPGEPQASWLVRAEQNDATYFNVTVNKAGECRQPPFASLLPSNFDRLYLPREDVVDDERLAKFQIANQERGLKPHQGERSRSFRYRNLNCATLEGADLRRADFTSARMIGVNLKDASLDGALLYRSRLHGVSLQGAQLREASLERARGQGASFDDAQLQGATIESAEFQRASINKAQLQKASLNDANLQGALLDDARLQGSSLKKAKLRGASLKGAELQNSVLTDADLDDANFQKASLGNVQLQRASLRRAKLQEAALASANLDDAEVQSALLEGVQLQNGSLRRVKLQEANLTGADLRDAVLDDAQLEGTILNEARLQGASLSNANLHGASLRRAKLQGTSLKRAQIQGANLGEAELQGADLDGAHLEGAYFRMASLQGSKLAKAKLQAANFADAEMQGVDLTGALLQGADLSRARLQGSSLAEAHLQGAIIPIEYLGLADLWGAFVWQTIEKPGPCPQESAWTGNLELGSFVEIQIRSDGSQDRVQASGEAIERLIDRVVSQLPEPRKVEVRETLRARLSAGSLPRVARMTEASWRRCSSASKKSSSVLRGEFEENLAKFLAKLACEDDPNLSHVASGVIRNWIAVQNVPTLFAAQLAINLRDQKSGELCRGAKSVREEEKKRVMDVTQKMASGSLRW